MKFDNWVMLPTNEKAPLILDNIKSKPRLLINTSPTNSLRDGYSFQHLYFLSDEEIKKGDWYIDDNILVRKSITSVKDYWMVRKDCKKIIAATDKSLVTEGKCWCMKPERGGCFDCNKPLPQPSESFIEAFVEYYNKLTPNQK